MPTLIRLLVILLVLAGIAVGAMFALVATVTPRDKQVTIRIPSRDLVPAQERDPLVRREIDTTRPAETPAAPAEPAVPADTPAAPATPAEAVPPPPADNGDGGDVVTKQQGIE